MSKFIEEHLFEFDKCFDEYSTNHDVESYLKINFYSIILLENQTHR